MGDKEDFEELGNFDGGDDDLDEDDDIGSGSGVESDTNSDSDSDSDSGESGSDSDSEDSEEDVSELKPDEIECEHDELDLPAEDDVSFMKNVTEQLKHKDSRKNSSVYLTKYEKARVLGVRAAQLENGAPALVPTTGMVSVVEIAEAELAAGKLPLVILRPDLNGKLHPFPVGQLIDVIPKV